MDFEERSREGWRREGDEKRRKTKKEEELKRKIENGGGGYGKKAERRERIRQSKYNNCYKWITEECLV